MKYYKGIISDCLDWRECTFRFFNVRIPAKKMNFSRVNYLADVAYWPARSNKPSKSDYAKADSTRRERIKKL